MESMQQIVNTGESDLFFNYRHDHRDKLLQEAGDDPVSEDDERAALTKDAEEFSTMYRFATGVSIEPDMLVEDFYDRL